MLMNFAPLQTTVHVLQVLRRLVSRMKEEGLVSTLHGSQRRRQGAREVCLQLEQSTEGIRRHVVLGEQGHQVFSRKASLVQQQKRTLRGSALVRLALTRDRSIRPIVLTTPEELQAFRQGQIANTLAAMRMELHDALQGVRKSQMNKNHG